MGALVPGELVNGERSRGSRPVQPADASPGASLILSEQEIRVLEALSQPDRLTLSQLMRATGLDGNELQLALSGLSMKGLIVRLETVIRSYSCHLAGPLAPSLRDEGQTLDPTPSGCRSTPVERTTMPYGLPGIVLAAVARSSSQGHVKEIMAKARALAEAASAVWSGNTSLQT